MNIGASASIKGEVSACANALVLRGRESRAFINWCLGYMMGLGFAVLAGIASSLPHPWNLRAWLALPLVLAVLLPVTVRVFATGWAEDKLAGLKNWWENTPR